MGLGSVPFTNNSTNFRSRAAVDGRSAASRNSSQVQPSLRGADFLGMAVNASEMALIRIGTNGVLKEDGGIGTWL